MIDVTCKSCGSRLKVSPTRAGRTVTCPNCKSGVQVPHPDTNVARTGQLKCEHCGAIHSPGKGGKFPVYCKQCGVELRAKTPEDPKRGLKLTLLWIALVLVFGGGVAALLMLEDLPRYALGLGLLVVAGVLVFFLNRLRE